MSISEASESFWWDVARACPQATFFHTPLWSRLVAQVYPQWRDHTRQLTLSNGVTGVLPLVGRANRVGLRVLKSTYAGCYGGAIWAETPDVAEVAHLYGRLVSGRVAQLQMTDNPLSPHPWPEAAHTADFTHLLRLDRPFEQLFTQFSKGHRSSTKKGQRLGVTTRVSYDLDDYRAYYAAYEDSLRRWGERATSRYTWPFFEAGWALSCQYPEQIKLWVAQFEGRLVAGAWVYYWNQHVDWWHGAAYEDSFQLCAPNVLQADIIADAVARGYGYYDFNPSGGHENVAKFKKRFGAEEWPVGKYHMVSQPMRWANWLREGMSWRV